MALPPQKTLAQMNAYLKEGGRIVDTRCADEYAAGHLPGTINLPLNDAFVTWAGWLLSYDHPSWLIADAPEVAQAQRLLSLIGLEHLAGYLPIEVIDQWSATGNTLEQLQKMDVAALYQRVKQKNIYVLDVRGASEYAAGHIEGARNIPLGYLERHLPELPTHQAIALHCQAGTRSALQAVFWSRMGFGRVVMSLEASLPGKTLVTLWKKGNL